MMKGYKYRIYPNEEQVVLIEKTIGCCRLVYNYMLNRKIKSYQRRNENLSKYDLIKLLPAVKKFKPFLKEVDSISLQQSIIHMDNAYQNFFKGHNKFPKFKSKHNPIKSYKTMGEGLKVLDAKYIQIPKIGKVRCKFHRQLNGRIISAVISKEAGRYYIAFCCEIDNSEVVRLPSTTNFIGIDLGVKEFAVDSNGITYENHKYLAKSLNKLKIKQERLSRKVKGSHNYYKQQQKVAKLHQHIKNQRLDYAHKLSTKLVTENQIICLEDLDIKGMLKKHNPINKTRDKVDNNKARAILDAGLGIFVTLLTYKAQTYGRDLIKINRFVPSSQMCNNCKTINPAVKDLTIREWVCPNCGASHNRDYNAALNILEEGLKLL